MHVTANSDFTLQFSCCRFCTLTLRSVCITTRLGDSAMSVLPMQPASRHIGLELPFLSTTSLVFLSVFTVRSKVLVFGGLYGFKRVFVDVKPAKVP